MVAAETALPIHQLKFLLVDSQAQLWVRAPLARFLYGTAALREAERARPAHSRGEIS